MKVQVQVQVQADVCCSGTGVLQALQFYPATCQLVIVSVLRTHLSPAAGRALCW